MTGQFPGTGTKNLFWNARGIKMPNFTETKEYVEAFNALCNHRHFLLVPFVLRRQYGPIVADILMYIKTTIEKARMMGEIDDATFWVRIPREDIISDLNWSYEQIKDAIREMKRQQLVYTALWGNPSFILYKINVEKIGSTMAEMPSFDFYKRKYRGPHSIHDAWKMKAEKSILEDAKNIPSHNSKNEELLAGQKARPIGGAKSPASIIPGELKGIESKGKEAKASYSGRVATLPSAAHNAQKLPGVIKRVRSTKIPKEPKALKLSKKENEDIAQIMDLWSECPAVTISRTSDASGQQTKTFQTIVKNVRLLQEGKLFQDTLIDNDWCKQRKIPRPYLTKKWSISDILDAIDDFCAWRKAGNAKNKVSLADFFLSSFQQDFSWFFLAATGGLKTKKEVCQDKFYETMDDDIRPDYDQISRAIENVRIGRATEYLADLDHSENTEIVKMVYAIHAIVLETSITRGVSGIIQHVLCPKIYNRKKAPGYSAHFIKVGSSFWRGFLRELGGDAVDLSDYQDWDMSDS